MDNLMEKAEDALIAALNSDVEEGRRYLMISIAYSLLDIADTLRIISRDVKDI